MNDKKMKIGCILDDSSSDEDSSSRKSVISNFEFKPVLEGLENSKTPKMIPHNYFDNESGVNQNKGLTQKSDNGEGIENSRRCSIFKLGELLSDIESFNESRTIIKGERDLYESFLMPRKSNTDSLNQFRMILDEKFGDQHKNMDRNLADEKNQGNFPN